MSIKNYNRQNVAAAHVTATLDDLADGAVAAVQLPGGAIVTGGYAFVTTAFDAGTTATLIVGDADDPDRYSGTPLDVSSAGAKAIVPNGYQMPVQGDLTVTFAQTGTAATEGELTLYIEYIDVQKVEWTQGR